MHSLFDKSVPKKPVSSRLNGDLLVKTRTMEINPSASLDRPLEQGLVEVEAGKWAEENEQAIASYNRFIEENGCFGDEFRAF